MVGRAEDEPIRDTIEWARRYRDRMRKWEAHSRDDPASSLVLWREVRSAEAALFAALDRLDRADSKDLFGGP